MAGALSGKWIKFFCTLLRRSVSCKSIFYNCLPEFGGSLLRADGIDKKTGAQLESGRYAGSGTDLNVPVKTLCKVVAVFYMGYGVKKVVVL